jgi:hypothetical protein
MAVNPIAGHGAVVSGNLGRTGARMPGLESGAPGRSLSAERLEAPGGPEPEDRRQTRISQWVRAQEDAIARRVRALARSHAK